MSEVFYRYTDTAGNEHWYDTETGHHVIWYRPETRNRCPVTCAQYRDGWNDAMNYIFRDGKGYRPYRRYQWDKCNTAVDIQYAFCRGCGRRFTDDQH